jgi:hypothetical protein
MTDNTCNGWRNAATWTVNLWFGDTWAEMAEDSRNPYNPIITADFCRDMVEEYVYDLIGRDSTTAGFIWDMLDLSAVDWDALAEHHADMMDEPA